MRPVPVSGLHASAFGCPTAHATMIAPGIAYATGPSAKIAIADQARNPTATTITHVGMMRSRPALKAAIAIRAPASSSFRALR